MDATSHSSSTVKATAPTIGPNRLPIPPNASITSTRTSTWPKANVDGAMNPSLWAYSGAGDAEHRRADEAGVHAIAGDVDAGQLGGDLVVAQGAERPTDVRSLDEPVQRQVHDHEPEQRVVRRHELAEERVRCRRRRRGRSRRR